MVHLAEESIFRRFLIAGMIIQLFGMISYAASLPMKKTEDQTMPAVETNKSFVPGPVESDDGSSLPGAKVIWPFMDHYYDVISQQVQDNTLRVDTFFDDDSSVTSNASCTLKLRLSTKFKYEQGFSIDPGAGVNVKLALPHLEKKWHVFVNNIQRDPLPGEDFPFSSAVSAGLSWNPFKKFHSLLSVDGGIRVDPWPLPFGVIEARHTFPLGCGVTAYPKQQVSWYDDEGFGELSQLDLEQEWVGPARFRSTTAVRWNEESDGVEGEQTFEWKITLEPGIKYVTPRVSLFWHKVSAIVADSYRIDVAYRTRIYRTWLFFEVKPQFEFPEENDYNFTPAIRFYLDIFFNGPPFD